MRKVWALAVLLSVVVLSCNRAGQYRIHGRVTSNELEGIQIFLVPVGHEEPWNVDSVYIHNHEFFFKGNQHWMCTLRLDKYHRDKGQNLLVATEPGDIYVTIGPDSSGGGTPLNDSLQVWKDLTIRENQLETQLRNAGLKAQADSAHNAYKERTWALVRAVGEESILGEFLLGMYPLPQE
jgi:hypothetical protein